MTPVASNSALLASGSQGLSPEEIERYRGEGQLTPRWRLPGAPLVRMQDALERLIAARPDLKPDFLPQPHTPWGDPAAESIAREFFAFANDPALLSLVGQLIGPDLVLWASAVFCKSAGTGLEAPWHQDGQ